MANILSKTRKTIIKWKDFQFPFSIKDFSMKEWAKVATYEYAWRNWAEHERVLSHRVFTLSGEFIAWVWSKEPKALVRDLRLTNDNKPWTFVHTDIWIFQCIISDLTISQNGEGYSTMLDGNSKLTSSFIFSIELLEHTPPNSKTLKEQTDELFPKSKVKPVSDIYQTELIYNNADELFDAIIEGKIAAWVNPIVNAEWLRYDFEMRAEAYLRWEATWFQIWTNEDTDSDIADINTNQKYYIVKAGDSWMKIAKAYSVTFTDLFEINRWVEVRSNTKGDEWLYWKTARILYAGDKILIPDWFTEPVKKTQTNKTDKGAQEEIVSATFIWPEDRTWGWFWTKWQPIMTEEDWFIYVY